uniref:Uncharacterized protein n=1 Tax=Aegilops tauschii TaxID=37682 RepID=M8C015_AEGTA
MVAGVPDRNLTYFNRKYNTRYLKHDDSVSHDALRIRSIVLSILHSEQVRSSLDWERVRWKASQIVKHLAYKAPELKSLVILPAGSMMPHDVLPIGFRYRRRRHVKEQDLPRPKTLAKIFLRTKKRYIWQQAVRPFDFTLSKNLSDLAYESLQAGLELQSSGKEGVPGATVSQTMSNTLTNAGAPVPSVSQTMSGTLTVPAKIYGAAVAAVSQAVNLTSHAENAGISAVTNAEWNSSAQLIPDMICCTNKVLSSENSNLRKHPRTEQAAFEQGPRPKTQRSSGAFGEACLASVTKVGACSQAGIVLEDPKHEVEQS